MTVLGRIVSVSLFAVAFLAPPSQAAFPGGSGRIAFVSERDGGPEIYSMAPDGSDQTRLTRSLSNHDPAWSPDGSKIAFASSRDGNWELYVMSKDGSEQTRLTDTPAAETSPAWAPDGNRLAFARCNEGSSELTFVDCELVTAKADGTDVATLSQEPSADFYNPAWSPDGAAIAYAKCPGFTIPPEPCRIYVSDADGTNERLLTGPSAVDPEWLPDAQRVAYTTVDSDGGSNLYTIGSDGSASARLMLGPGHEFGPTWAPDGSQVAFESNPVDATDSSTVDVWVANTDGAGLRQLTVSPGEDSSADWQTCVANDCEKPPPPPPMPPGPPAVVSDSPKAPKLSISSRNRQRLLRQGGIVVQVNCADQACEVVASASISVPKRAARVYRLRARAQLAKGQTARLKLRLTRSAKKAMRRAFRTRRLLRAKLRVTAKGPTAGASAQRRTILLRK